MKQQKNNMPTFWLIIVSTMLLTIVTGIYRETAYSSYKIDIEKEPLLTVLMQGFSDRIFPWSNSRNDTAEVITKVPDINEILSETLKDETVSSDTVSSDTLTYSFSTVDASYFDDALFIGDSRTVGLNDYSNLKNATFYAKVSSTIYNIMEDPIITAEPSEIPYYGSREISITQALSKKQFHKIYIMVGINELGTGTVDTYFEKFKEVVETIQTLQPDSIIFIESIMHVTTEKSNSDAIYNNQNINERNEKLKTLADNQNVFYLDINEVLDDDTGGLNPEYTFDSVHLKASKYTLWEDYLLAHGIQK
ncbi:MAG: GDSL-type esterase/lipase family protein [Lachnospiraceae bacterium]|nr:GDSL-type esterase/lipase family protein [Lachnospiraceae bacterium]